MMINKKQLYFGLVLTVFNAFCCFFLALKFFENHSRLPVKAFYNAGVDVMGAFACAVLFYGCMEQADEAARNFVELVVLTSVGFILNEWMFFLSGLTNLRGVVLLICVACKWMDFCLAFHFFRFVSKNLSFEGRLSRAADKGFLILLLCAMALAAANLFVPICFSVDAEGAFHKETLYWLMHLYLIIVASFTAVLLYRSKVSNRQKWVALSFIMIPFAHYLVTKGAFGYATQYGSDLLALIMMYCVIFNEKSQQLTAARTELTMATEIQKSVLPDEFPAFPDRSEFDLYASSSPAKEVGGDFYDFFLIDDDHLCMVMADASGKGVPAALFMMSSKIILQIYATMDSSPADILTKTNKLICANNKTEMFVTVWIGILEISTGKLVAGNAGHEYPAIKQAGGRFELYKDRHDIVVGGMEGVQYREYEIQLKAGDKIFVYTDGVPEAMSSRKELFGTKRMVEALNKAADGTPKDILTEVRNAVDGFVGKAEQFDDLTMLCLEYKGPQEK